MVNLPKLYPSVAMKIITVGYFYSVGDFRLVIFLVWYLVFVMHFIVVDISAMSNTQRGMILAFTTVDVVGDVQRLTQHDIGQDIHEIIDLF